MIFFRFCYFLDFQCFIFFDVFLEKTNDIERISWESDASGGQAKEAQDGQESTCISIGSKGQNNFWITQLEEFKKIQTVSCPLYLLVLRFI